MDETLTGTFKQKQFIVWVLKRETLGVSEEDTGTQQKEAITNIISLTLQLRFFSALRIRVQIGVMLKKIDSSLSQRTKNKLSATMTQNCFSAEIIATKRSSAVVLQFFERTAQIHNVRQLVFSFLSKVNLLQSRWKQLLMQDAARMERIKLKWNTVVDDLIKKNANRGKRQQQFARKLRQIDPEFRNNTIKKYYKNLKNKHIDAIHRYLKAREQLSPEQKRAVGIMKHMSTKFAKLFEGLSVSELEEKKYQVTEMKGLSEAEQLRRGSRFKPLEKKVQAKKEETLAFPVFQFYPSSELMATLITKAVEDKY